MATLRNALLGCLAFLLPLMTTRADAGFMVERDQLVAVGSEGKADATAAHGVFLGNTEGSGDSFDTLLKKGGNAWINYSGEDYEITISGSGMFSMRTFDTTEELETLLATDNPTVDLIVGDDFTPVTGSWTSEGKTDMEENVANGPFEVVGDDVKEGRLTLIPTLSPLSGDAVIALKGGNFYAVYAFKGLVEATHFEFAMDAIIQGNSNPGLSHASLYSSYTPPTPPNDPNTVPEPSSLAIFGLIGLGVMTTMVRRRRQRTLVAA